MPRFGTVVNNYYESDTNKAYTYQTFNFVVNRKFNEKTRLFAGVDNVFNKKIERHLPRRPHLAHGR